MNCDKNKKIRFPKTIVSLLLATFFLPSFSLAQQLDGPDIPDIIPRTSWIDSSDLEGLLTWIPDRNKKEGIPDYADVSRIVIHDLGCSLDSPTCNSDDTDPVFLLKNLYRFHAQTRNWGDIGYNYIIDRRGNIYEGRFGGNGARGAHTYYDRKCINFNVGTAGIALMGNFDKTDMPEAMYEGLAKLVAWISANNGINPAEMNEDALNWQNPKKDDGKCDTSNGFFTKAFSGPAVVGHGDVEDGNPDPGVVDLGKVRAKSFDYYQKYKNYAFQAGGDMAVYVMEDGYKKKFDSLNALPAEYGKREIKPIIKTQLDFYVYKDARTYPDGSLLKILDDPAVYFMDKSLKRKISASNEEMGKMGFKPENIKIVQKSDLKLYDDGKAIKYSPDKKLIKDSAGNVYLLENGRKRKFTSPGLFEHLKYKWKDIKSDDNFEFYIDGPDMVYPDGTLISGKANNKIYLVDNLQRREISANLFKFLGYKKEKIVLATDDELNHFPEGKKMLYPENTLIKANNSATVYLVKDGKRKEFASQAVFAKWGYKWKNVIVLKADEINYYPPGRKVLYPDKTLIKFEKNPTVYLIESGKKRKITSQALFRKLGYKEKDVIVLKLEELSDYPDGGFLKYPENTLFRKKGDDKIYVIKNGKAEWVKTAEEFRKAKYKWSSVIETTSDELNLYLGGAENIKSSDTNNPKAGEQKKSGTRQANPVIKVAIYSTNKDSVRITASGNYSVNYYDSAGKVYKTENKSSGEQTVIPYFSGQSHIKAIPSSANAILQILSYGDLSWNKEMDDNKFRGNIEIRYSDLSQKLWIINELPLEDYVNGIAEAANDSPAEYLKAFSTIARTYAIYYIEKGGKHSGEPFHLKNSRNGNGNDQVYRGYNFEMRAPKIIAANKIAAGNIITFNGNPIVAAYSSDSGGITKSGCEFLSKNYCADEFSYLKGGIKDPENTAHNADKISASHGVGMSAVGAYQMAANGSSWREIIKYYYPGVEIETLK